MLGTFKIYYQCLLVMESPLTLHKKTERNFNLCILCQKRKNFKKNDRLVEHSEHESDVLKAAYLRRKELPNELGEPDE